MDYESGVEGQAPALVADTALPSPPDVSYMNGSVVYSSEHARGTMALKHAPVSGDISTITYGASSSATLTTTALAARAYFYFTVQPVGALVSLYDSSDQWAAAVGINNAANPGKLYIQDFNRTPALAVGAVTNPLPLNQWVRFELYATASTSGATITAAVYDGTSTTPIDRLSSTTAVTMSTTSATFSWARFGKNNYNTYATPYWLDDTALDTAATGLFTEITKPSPFYVWNGAEYKQVAARVWSGSGYRSVIDE